MKATEAKLLDFLKKSPQFVIPIYQRTYSWSEQQCRQLWDDIMRAGTNDGISAHFIGSVVYIEKGLYQVSSQSPLLVIDGQQRLTTTMLILEALSRHLGNTETLEVCSVNYLGRFSGNYPGRLIPIFNYRCSLPFCDGNFHLRNEGLSHDAPADRWRRWSSLSRRTVHPIARTTCLM